MKQGATGLQAKLMAIGALTALLATDPDTNQKRIQEGWPAEDLEDPQPERYPMITYELPTLKPLADGIADMSGLVHLFTWNGQRDELDQLERVLRKELDQKRWTHDGAGICATLGIAIDDPARKQNEAEHRAVAISLLVSEE